MKKIYLYVAFAFLLFFNAAVITTLLPPVFFLNVTTPLLFTVATFLLLEVQIRLDGLTTPEEVFTCSFVFFPAATFLVVPVIVSFGWLEVTLVVVLFFSQIAI